MEEKTGKIKELKTLLVQQFETQKAKEEKKVELNALLADELIKRKRSIRAFTQWRSRTVGRKQSARVTHIF